METKSKKNLLKIVSNVIRGSVRFTLHVIANTLKASKETEHEPTPHELSCGKKMLLSDKYLIQNPKKRK